jgi:hypothetical protein
VRCLVGGFAVFELSESPVARRCVLFGVLDHEPNICGRPCNERLFTTKDFVVFLRWDVAPGQPRNNCAVREWKPLFPIGFDSYVVAQNSTKIIEVAASWATEITLQSRYPGGILIPKTGAVSPSAGPAARAFNAAMPTTVATTTSKKAILFVITPSKSLSNTDPFRRHAFEFLWRHLVVNKNGLDDSIFRHNNIGAVGRLMSRETFNDNRANYTTSPSISSTERIGAGLINFDFLGWDIVRRCGAGLRD